MTKTNETTYLSIVVLCGNLVQFEQRLIVGFFECERSLKCLKSRAPFIFFWLLKVDITL
jgi:hypothetical protein